MNTQANSSTKTTGRTLCEEAFQPKSVNGKAV